MAQQLRFDLPVRPALGRGDFFVSPSNARAVALVDTPSLWPSGKLVLHGPAGAGKTHLAHVWAAGTGGCVVEATSLKDADVPMLAETPVAVEDVPRAGAGAQTALFHLHNLLQAAGLPLLLTGQEPPERWRLALPDLESRIAAAQSVALEPPDDALLAAVLAKLLADRQIVPKPGVIPYLVAHMDRAFDAAAQVVERLDDAALGAGPGGVTRPLAVRVLADLRQENSDATD